MDSKIKNSPERKLYMLYLAIIATLLFTMVNGQVIWFDEAFSLQLSKLSVKEIIRYTASDVHPPLYYLILRAFVSIFGNSMLVCHLVSILPFFVMLCVIGQSMVKRFGYWDAAIAVVLVAGAPNFMNFALEIRMYSWAILMVTLSFFQALTILEEEEIPRKDWILFAIYNVLAAYLHYFAGAAVIVISGWLLLLGLFQKKKKASFGLHWLGSSALTFVLYLPWMLVFLQQLAGVKEDYWIPPFTMSNLNNYLEFALGREQLVKKPLMLFMLLVLILLLANWKKLKEEGNLIFLSFGTFGGFVLLGILLSIFVTPVFVERYISLVIPFLWIGVAVIFFRLENKYLTTGLLAISLVLLFVSYYGEFHHRTDEENTTAVTYLQEHMDPEDALLHTSAHTLGELVYYFPNQQEYIRSEVISHEAFQDWNQVASCDYLENYADCNASKLWLFQYNTEDDVAGELRQAGYQVKDLGSFTLGYDGWATDYIDVELYYCTR